MKMLLNLSLAALTLIFLSRPALATPIAPSKTPEVERKAAAGCINEQTYLGYYFWVNGDFEQAKTWLLKAAQAGDPEAEYRLGGLYDKGQGTKQDYAEAISWYRKAAAQEYPLARDRLFKMYSSGEGVKRDQAEASKWKQLTADDMKPLLEHAENGDAEAQFKVGKWYWRWSAYDEPNATKWFRKSAAQGYMPAFYWLGLMYEGSYAIPTDEGRLTPDQAQLKALPWFRKAAAAGDHEAQLVLGEEYYDGKPGVPQDYKEAYYWLSLAYDPCDPFEEGLTWIPKAASHLTREQREEVDNHVKADRGDVEAQARLADAYFNGRGVAQDFSQAYFWYSLAASKKKRYAAARDSAAAQLTSEEKASVDSQTRSWKPLSAAPKGGYPSWRP